MRKRTARPATSKRVNQVERASTSYAALSRACEALERRVLLCGGHYDFENFARDFPDEAAFLANPPVPATLAPNSADIVWSNRGSSGDNFASVFGANATAAREVVDAVLRHYERVITSFNHFNDVNVINVSISMDSSGTGHGGGAGSYVENAAGQPTGGAIVLDRGDDLNGDGRGDGGGYFIDPTPDDYSEFMGNITNAFAVDAHAGSPASGRSDLYTLVALELTHVLGINSGSNIYHSQGHYTNTNIADTAEGGGVGKFYVYDSPTIKHLMTSNNGGPSGSDRGKPLHGAGPGAPINFNGQTWEGAQDSMNAMYEFGRRYLVPETSRLIMQDGLLYSTVPAQTFGTAYATLNQAAGTLTVRGNPGVSNDVITVDFVDNRVVVTVDVPVDFPGTWTAPGGGDFPAWRSEFFPIEVDSIVINAGEGNDTIRVLGVPPGRTVTVNAGAGNDFIQIGDGVIDTGLFSPVTVIGGPGNDTLSYNDLFDDVGNDEYIITSTTVQKALNFTRVTYSTDMEAVSVLGSERDNTFNINSTSSNVAYTFFGQAGDDTFNIVPGQAASISVQGGIGNNTLRINDSAGSGAPAYTVNSGQVLRTNARTVTHNLIQNVVVDATAGNNTFNLATDDGSPAITLNGHAGNDLFLMDVSHYTNPTGQKPITMNGGEGSDASSIFVRLNGVTSVFTSSVTGNGATVHHNSLERLDLVGGHLHETFVLHTTPAGMLMQIFAGDGNDTIYLGGAFAQPYKLDDIQAPVTVRGEGGVDVLVLIDTPQTAARTYNVTSLDINATTMASVAYDSSVEGISLTGGAGGDNFNVLATQAFAPVTLNGGNGADSFFVTHHAANSFVTIDGQAGLDSVFVNNDNSGTARVRFQNSQDLERLSLFTGGSAVVEAGAGATLYMHDFFFAANSLLDLNDNDMIVNYTGSSPLVLIQSRINLARGTGAWTGTAGITSTVARNANPKNTTLGAMEATHYKSMNGAQALFNGTPLDDTAVLVKYTYYGDTDFNGVVNFDDYSRLDSGFLNNRTGWMNGDFNGDGVVNFDDYSLIDQAFLTQGPVLRPAPAGAGGGKQLAPGRGAVA